MKDILENYKNEIDYQKYSDLSLKSLNNLNRPFWQPLITNLNELKVPQNLVIDADCFSKSLIEIGDYTQLLPQQHELLDNIITKLIPWRKGPFSLFGHLIDTEWVSDLKWQRLIKFVPSLEKKRIVDIGCNNGYYMWRLWGLALQRGENPEIILGMDPSEIFYFSFQLFQKFIQNQKLIYKICGVEEIDIFPKFFDLALYLGVIYHQKDPLTSLYKIKESLKPGGQLILETIIFPGEEDFAYFVKDRYAKMRNVYFLPTKSCLCSWLEKVGFENMEMSDDVLITEDEQRKTAFMPYESLEDYLDKSDPSKTIEGLPAPRRVIVKARLS